MSAKHTPGPWVAREWVCRAKTSVGRASDNLLGFEQIAECSGNGRQVSPEQEEADARLIAAAPDLLAALRDVIDGLSMGDQEGLIEYAPQMIAARAAIAKATKEST